MLRLICLERQFGQDIASIQRLGSRSEPLGAGGRTAPPATVDRQLQNLQQCQLDSPCQKRGGSDAAFFVFTPRQGLEPYIASLRTFERKRQPMS